MLAKYVSNVRAPNRLIASFLGISNLTKIRLLPFPFQRSTNVSSS